MQSLLYLIKLQYKTEPRASSPGLAVRDLKMEFDFVYFKTNELRILDILLAGVIGLLS